ncbi:MAG TPA: hypothetical protein PKL31_03495 [Fulvivirga sp.]|nr:hypothetical protein [Fulvivirga sp.]
MTKYRKGIILTLGLVIALAMITFGFTGQKAEPVEGLEVKGLAENELLQKYKSTIPMVTAPLYIIAKGLKLAE